MRLSEKTIAHLERLKQPILEAVTVKYYKGGGSATVDIPIRKGDDPDRIIRSVIGWGVHYEILDDEDNVLEIVEEDPESQAALNEKLNQESIEIVEDLSSGSVQDNLPKKKRGRPRKKKA